MFHNKEADDYVLLYVFFVMFSALLSHLSLFLPLTIHLPCFSDSNDPFKVSIKNKYYRSEAIAVFS